MVRVKEDKTFLTRLERIQETHPVVYKAIKKCGGDTQKIYDLGVQFRKNEQFHDAFECFRCIAGMKKGTELDAKVFHNMGVIMWRFKESKTAEKFFTRASSYGLVASKRNLEVIKKERAAREKEEAQQYQVEKDKKRVSRTIDDSLLSEGAFSAKFQSSVEKLLKERGLSNDPKLKAKLLSQESVVRREALKNRNELRRKMYTVIEDLGSLCPLGLERFYRIAGDMSDKINPDKKVLDADLFEEKHLIELARVARLIYDKTNEGDCVLFLGRSPLWIFEMFSALKLPRETLSVPCSGVSKLHEKVVWEFKEEAFSAFKMFLRERQGLTKEFFEDKPNKRLFIIDRIETGASVLFFRRLLGEINPGFNNKTCPIIGFGNEERTISADEENVSFILMENSTLLETCKKHKNYQKYTLGIEFYPDEWIDWEKKDFDLKPSIVAQARQGQIYEWAKNELDLAPEGERRKIRPLC